MLSTDLSTINRCHLQHTILPPHIELTQLQQDTYLNQFQNLEKQEVPTTQKSHSIVARYGNDQLTIRIQDGGNSVE